MPEIPGTDRDFSASASLISKFILLLPYNASFGICKCFSDTVNGKVREVSFLLSAYLGLGCTVGRVILDFFYIPGLTVPSSITKSSLQLFNHSLILQLFSTKTSQ